MLRSGIIFLTGWLAVSGVTRADGKVVQSFDGTAAQTTPAFQVQDGWKVHWVSPNAVTITVVAADGSTAAGVTGVQTGDLDLPKGGTYSLKISPVAATAVTWHVDVQQPGLPPAALPAAGATAASAGAFGLNLSTNSALPAAPGPAVSDGGTLTQEQSHAIVVIKGDAAEGTGFLVRGADGPAVVTNLHVLSANPNVKILTTTGEQIKTTGLKGASDRDLAMISIQDNHYSYLDLATDIPGTVQNDDNVITPGNSEGGEVVLDTKGTVLGVGPERIEFSNPIYHGNSGGPVFHTKSGKVIAVVTQALKVRMTNEVDKASFENKNSAITGSMRYFGLRLDTVPRWETYDWDQFLRETTFISDFHDVSRCLDSYMNGARYERAQVATTDEYGPPNSQYYLKNEKLQEAHDNYHRLATDADESQKLDAGREIVMDLEGVAGTNMDAIQNPNNFYSFNQIRAQEEIKYRQALQKEIESAGDKLSDMGH